MRRREVLTLLGSAAAWPLVARGQQGDRPLLGVIGPHRESVAARAAYPVMVDELRKLGFADGRNLVVEYRRIDQGVAQAFAGANELAAAKANVLFAFGPEIALQAATAVRPSIPVVVLANNFDPIERGYAKSLAQPGGDVTGIVSRQLELAGKQLALLAEAFPERTRVGALWDALSADQYAASERAAPSIRLSLRSVWFERPPYDMDAAFNDLTRDGVQALLVLSSPLFIPYRAKIAELAMQNRLPSMYTLKHWVEAGGLMSYGVDFGPMMRRAASIIAKILRGAAPADLPIEQVDSFEFVVNLKTAKAMGLTLPTSILLRANEVIE